MNVYKLNILCLVVFIIGNTLGYAQQDADRKQLATKKDSLSISQDEYKPISLGLKVESMHLWRGFRVTDATNSVTTLTYKSKNGKLAAGFYGAYSFNGFYTEFDNYISYSTHGFTASVWDINNFTNYQTDYYDTNSDFFDYSRRSSRFVEATLAYQFQSPNFPLSISWTTILLGRDYFVDRNGNDEGRFSTYIQASAPIYKDSSDGVLSVGIGGAFALNNLSGIESHFYGSKPNLVNVYLTYSKSISLLNYEIPLSAKAMYNPERQISGLEISVVLY